MEDENQRGQDDNQNMLVSPANIGFWATSALARRPMTLDEHKTLENLFSMLHVGEDVFACAYLAMVFEVNRVENENDNKPRFNHKSYLEFKKMFFDTYYSLKMGATTHQVGCFLPFANEEVVDHVANVLLDAIDKQDDLAAAAAEAAAAESAAAAITVDNINEQENEELEDDQMLDVASYYARRPRSYSANF